MSSCSTLHAMHSAKWYKNWTVERIAWSNILKRKFFSLATNIFSLLNVLEMLRLHGSIKEIWGEKWRLHSSYWRSNHSYEKNRHLHANIAYNIASIIWTKCMNEILTTKFMKAMIKWIATLWKEYWKNEIAF